MKYLKINIWDLNFILTMVGFGFFTTFVDSSAGSIAYRGFALLVALVCLLKSMFRFPDNKYIKAFLFTFAYITLQVTIDFYLIDNTAVLFSYSRLQSTLYNFGIVGIPMLAFLCGIKKIQWETALTVLLMLMIFTVGVGIKNTFSSEMTTDGRFNMNARVSTLQFGDNAAYLVLLSTAMLMRSKVVKDKVFLRVLSCAAIGLGVWGVAKAGSRGPLVGMCAGLMFLFVCLSKKAKTAVITTFTVVLFGGFVSFKALETFAPALVQRFTETVEDGDLGNRDILFEQALSKFSEGLNWLIGTNPYYLEIKEFSSCHNMYLEMLIGTGVIGFAIFLYSTLGVGCLGLVKHKLLPKIPEVSFLFALLFFNLARGMSGIMVIANPILAFSVIGAAFFIKYAKPKHPMCLNLN